MHLLLNIIGNKTIPENVRVFSFDTVIELHFAFLSYPGAQDRVGGPTCSIKTQPGSNANLISNL